MKQTIAVARILFAVSFALAFSAPASFAQPATVMADPTTGVLSRPSAATFITGNSLLTTTAAAAAYQPLDADLTSWAAITRASGFDTFTATPTSANLAATITNETGSGSLVFATSPTFVTPILGNATATSVTAPASTDLTLAGGSSGTTLTLAESGANTTTLAIPSGSGNEDYFAVNVTGAASHAGSLYGMRVFLTQNAASNAYSTGAFLGEYYTPTSNSSNYTTRQQGVYGYIHHEGSGLISDARAVFGITGIFGTGNIGTGAGGRFIVQTLGGSSGSFTNATGVLIDPPTFGGSGAATNVYGLYIDSQAGGTSTNHQIYSAGTALSYFGGPITTAGLLKSTAGAQSTRDSIGTTVTDGLLLDNSTAAASGMQQYSPALRLSGYGWKTTATAASQRVDWIAYNRPVQGAAAPTTQLKFAAQVNGGSYTDVMTLDSNGPTIYFLGNQSYAGDAIPSANATYDLGSSGTKWRQGFFSGAVTTGALTATSIATSQTPSASVATASTHKVAIVLNGTTYYILLTNVP